MSATQKLEETIEQAIGRVASAEEMTLLSTLLTENTDLKNAILSVAQLTKDSDATLDFSFSKNEDALANFSAVYTGGLVQDANKKSLSALLSQLAEIDGAHLVFGSDKATFCFENKVSLSKEVSPAECNLHLVSSGNDAKIPLATFLEGESISVGKTCSDSDKDEFDINTISEPEDLREVAISMMSRESLSAKKWINSKITGASTSSDANSFEQNGVTLLVSLDANSSYASACTEEAAKISLATASRNIVMSGGVCMTAISNTNILNTSADDLSKKINGATVGLSEGLAEMNFTIADASVSVHNNLESDTLSTISTVGVLGTLGKSGVVMTNNFKNKGDLIFILGESKDCISGSEYVTSFHNIENSGTPYFNFVQEIQLQKTISAVIAKDLINAAHGISTGGLYTALTQMGLDNELGFDIVTDSEVREDAFLFGEGQSKALVTVNEDQEDDFIEHLMASGTQFTLLGHVTKGKMIVDDVHFGFINEVKDVYEHAVENALNA